MRICRFLMLLACALLIAACATAPSKPVEFATEPQTSDELAVAQRMEAFIVAWNDHGNRNEQSVDKFISFFAPDAKIDSLVTGKIVSRDEFKTSILALREFSKVALWKTTIRMVPPDGSRVESELLIFGAGGTTKYPAIYDFLRRNGQWLIVEQKHH